MRHGRALERRTQRSFSDCFTIDEVGESDVEMISTQLSDFPHLKCGAGEKKLYQDLDMNIILQGAVQSLILLDTNMQRKDWCTTFNKRWTECQHFFLCNDEPRKMVDGAVIHSPRVHRVRFSETVLYKTQRRVTFETSANLFTRAWGAYYGHKREPGDILKRRVTPQVDFTG